MFSDSKIEINCFTASTDFAEFQEQMKMFFICFIILFVVVLCVNIFKRLNSYYCYSFKYKFTVPPENMPRIEGEKYTWTFHRVNMSEKTFFNFINQWLANEQGIVVLKYSTDTFVADGHNISNNYYSSLTLIYTYSNQSNYKYGIDSLNKRSLFRTSVDMIVSEWKQNHPQAEIVRATDSMLFSISGGSKRAQVCILYRCPIENANGTPQKSISQYNADNGLIQNQTGVVYCTNCGQKMPYGAKYCLNCGKPMTDSYAKK